MPPAVEAGLAVILLLATSVWLGGIATLVVVTRVAGSTLDQKARVMFFRRVGRTHGSVSAISLAVGLVAGAVLVRDEPGGLRTGAAVVAGLVVVATAAGVVQARRMTRLRASALGCPENPEMNARIRRGAREAGLLRGLLAGLSLVLAVLGVLLAR